MVNFTFLCRSFDPFKQDAAGTCPDQIFDLRLTPQQLIAHLMVLPSRLETTSQLSTHLFPTLQSLQVTQCSPVSLHEKDHCRWYHFLLSSWMHFKQCMHRQRLQLWLDQVDLKAYHIFGQWCSLAGKGICQWHSWLTACASGEVQAWQFHWWPSWSQWWPQCTPTVVEEALPHHAGQHAKLIHPGMLQALIQSCIMDRTIHFCLVLVMSSWSAFSKCLWGS